MGAAVGAAAALLTTIGDFGAHWLWMQLASDRIRLLGTMLGLQIPAGVLLGAALGAFIALTERPMRAALRTPRVSVLRAAQLTAFAAPGLASVAYLLFTGGQMSRLPAVQLLRGATALGLIACASLAFWLALRLRELARVKSFERGLALIALAFGFALGKLDQIAMPGLYAYLHGLLGVGAWLVYCGALFVWLEGCSTHAAHSTPGANARWRVLGLVLALLLAPGWLYATVLSLDQNQNVRVALLHPNASTTRSVMLALGPSLLEPLQARAIAEARARRRLLAASAGQTTAHPGALRLGDAGGPRFENAHVLLITVDALRPDHLGFNGYARPTSPALDALAAQSVVFERAYTAAPHSSYSLCSLMTSEYLHETLDLGLPAPTETLASALTAVGYHTAAFYTLGIFHTAGERLVSYEKNALGFALHDHVTYEAEALTDRVLAEVERTVSRGEPSTFVWAHYFDVHEPYEDTRFGSSDIDRYDGEIRKVDAAIARLIRQAREKLSRAVVVLITADHGEEFREHGGVYHGSSLYDEQVRVPLLVNAPGLSARRVSAPVETIAIAPTLLELVGAPVPSSMRGDDLRPLLVGQNVDVGPAFAAVTYKKMVAHGSYKLIADLRFGSFELYDLEHDPHERENLWAKDAARSTAMRDEIYGWLDSLAPPNTRTAGAAAGKSTHQQALDLGKLGDRRAVPLLVALARDEAAPVAERGQACRMLGHLADETSADALAGLLGGRVASVAAEAAIALGRMFDPRARATLRRVVFAEDPDVRTRAAVSLGRLRDRAAVPALIEALWVAPREYEREEAIRWLGRLGDVKALEALLQTLPEGRTRHLAVVAIGRLKDPRAFTALADVLARERLEDVRSATVQGFGYLGDPRAIELVLPLIAQDAAVSSGTETLVRLGALQSHAVGGADVLRGDPSLRGFGKCFVGDPAHDWDYQHRTSCTTAGSDASLRVEIPKHVAAAPVIVLLSARRADAAHPASVRVSIGKSELARISLDGSWSEARIALPAGALAPGKHTLRIQSDPPEARIDLDHALIVPRTPPATLKRASN